MTSCPQLYNGVAAYNQALPYNAATQYDGRCVAAGTPTFAVGGGSRIHSASRTVRMRYRRDDELIWMAGGHHA